METRKLDRLVNLVGELMVTHSRLATLSAEIPAELAGRQQVVLSQLDQNARALEDCVLDVRMVPVGFVFQRLPRLVRDLGRRLKRRWICAYSEATPRWTRLFWTGLRTP